MNMGACPECDADVLFDVAPVLNQRVTCSRCRAALVVIGLTPVELDWAFVEPLRDLHLDGTDRLFTHDWRSET